MQTTQSDSQEHATARSRKPMGRCAQLGENCAFLPPLPKKHLIHSSAVKEERKVPHPFLNRARRLLMRRPHVRANKRTRMRARAAEAPHAISTVMRWAWLGWGWSADQVGRIFG
jgi:hypothetical protein